MAYYPSVSDSTDHELTLVNFLDVARVLSTP